MDRALALLSAVCAGVLLCAGAIVAPVSFVMLAPDRTTAGLLAAQVFELCYWFSAGVGALALARIAAQRTGKRIGELVSCAVLLGSSVAQLALITPALRNHGKGWPFSFGTLHAAASAIHAAMILSALYLAWRLAAPKETLPRVG